VKEEDEVDALTKFNEEVEKESRASSPPTQFPILDIESLEKDNQGDVTSL
jgi:hypothetical protein